jgi:hypothetical protein
MDPYASCLAPLVRSRAVTDAAAVGSDLPTHSDIGPLPMDAEAASLRQGSNGANPEWARDY